MEDLAGGPGCFADHLKTCMMSFNHQWGIRVIERCQMAKVGGSFCNALCVALSCWAASPSVVRIRVSASGLAWLLFLYGTSAIMMNGRPLCSLPFAVISLAYGQRGKKAVARLWEPLTTNSNWPVVSWPGGGTCAELQSRLGDLPLFFNGTA